MTAPFLSVILPIYNEEARLHHCLDQLTEYFWNYTHYPFEILCMLNGCTDRSAEICLGYYEKWTQIRFYTLQEKGKGQAVAAGMLRAHGTYRMMMDVDLATPPTEVPRFLAAMKNADLVVGRRNYHHKNPVRALAHLFYRMLCLPMTWVHDPQCGFKMFRDACAEYVFSRLTTTGWGFDVEALYLAREFRTVEIEVPWEHDGRSKLNPIRDGWKMAKELLAIRRHHTIEHHPV